MALPSGFIMMRRMKLVLRMALVLVCFLGVRFTAHADQSALTVENPYVRVTIPGRPAAGYIVIKNASGKADAVVSANSPKAERIELHTHLMDGAVMRMRPVEKVDVPANGSAEFKSGGDHLMLFGLDPSVTDGSDLPVTLQFSSGASLDVTFRVGKAGAARGGPGHQHRKH